MDMCKMNMRVSVTVQRSEGNEDITKIKSTV